MQTQQISLNPFRKYKIIDKIIANSQNKRQNKRQNNKPNNRPNNRKNKRQDNKKSNRQNNRTFKKISLFPLLLRFIHFFKFL